jgi:hypothetical protein
VDSAEGQAAVAMKRLGVQKGDNGQSGGDPQTYWSRFTDEAGADDKWHGLSSWLGHG